MVRVLESFESPLNETTGKFRYRRWFEENTPDYADKLTLVEVILKDTAISHKSLSSLSESGSNIIYSAGFPTVRSGEQIRGYVKSVNPEEVVLDACKLEPQKYSKNRYLNPVFIPYEAINHLSIVSRE